MEKLFELTFQDQTLNPQVGTYTDTTAAAGTFTLEDGEYYLTNGGAKGFYTYAPIAIQPDSGTDNKVTIEFDLKVLSISALAHTIFGSFDQLDINGEPVQTCWLLNYNQGNIEFVHSGGSAVTLIAAADVVVDQWYHFKIECSKGASSSLFSVEIDSSPVADITSAASNYKFDIMAVLGTGLHACDECGIKNIRLITDDDYFVGRTALNQALTDTKGYVDSQVGACVPRAGGAVLTGTALYKTTDSDSVTVGGGSTYAKGGSITCVGKDSILRAGAVWLLAEDGTYHARLMVEPDGTATLDNNGTTKNLAMQENVVPRSGGAVITGDFIGRTVNNASTRIDGGTAWNNGATIVLCGKEHPSSPGLIWLHVSNGSDEKDMQLYPSGTWTWDGTACQLISDQRYKQQISEIDDKLLDAWQDVDLVQFKYNDAVDQKGKDKARLHTGYVVQQIDNACKSHGVDVSAYGLYCHEQYPEETEEVEVEQADGTKTKETKVICEASEHYSLRYTEALIVECKYLRRCIARLTARIEELEKGKEQEAGK